MDSISRVIGRLGENLVTNFLLAHGFHVTHLDKGVRGVSANVDLLAIHEKPTQLSSGTKQHGGASHFRVCGQPSFNLAESIWSGGKKPKDRANVDENLLQHSSRPVARPRNGNGVAIAGARCASRANRRVAGRLAWPAPRLDTWQAD